MPELYEPRGGDPVSASQQAELVRLAKRKFSGPGVLETPDGVHFREQARIRPITVVVVKEPVEEDKTLIVRKVAEKKDPPEDVGQYELVSDRFEAWPDFGRTAIEYKDFYIGIFKTLEIGTVFLQARRVRSIWKVEFPAGVGDGAIKFAVVTSLTGDIDILKVKYVDNNGNSVGEDESAFVWPNMKNTDWKTFIGTNIVIPVVIRKGIPYAMQLPRWEMMLPPSGLVIGSCPFTEA